MNPLIGSSTRFVNYGQLNPISERVRIAFLSDTVPQHFGNGSAVYPYFVIRALESQGVEVETIIPDGLKTFKRPFAWNAGSRVFGWIRVGRLSFSVSAYEWALHNFRLVRKKLFGKRKPLVLRVNKSSSVRTTRLGKTNPELTDYLRYLDVPVVIVNHPYRLAEIGPQLREKTKVLVLTHDVISDRTAKFAAMGWEIDFAPLTREQEVSLLEKADTIVAISDDDKTSIKTLVPKKTIITCFPPFIDAKPMPFEHKRGSERMRCLFVGGGAVHNRHTLHWLLDDAWPKISELLPKAELLVVGGVGHTAKQEALDPSVQIAGRITDIAEAYRDTDLVLAPVLEGTGVKMKLLEAVRFGVPAVTSPEGLRGLPGNVDEIFPTASSGSELATLVASLTSRSALDDLALSQQSWARVHLAPDQLVSDLIEELTN